MYACSVHMIMITVWLDADALSLQKEQSWAESVFKILLM